MAVHNDHNSPRYRFNRPMFDLRDPLTQALDRFMTRALDHDFHLMDPLHRWGEPLNARPIDFDLSLV